MWQLNFKMISNFYSTEAATEAAKDDEESWEDNCLTSENCTIVSINKVVPWSAL